MSALTHGERADRPTRTAPPIDRLSVAVYRVPTDEPESDGTLVWDHTDVVVVELGAGDHSGLGYSYASRASESLIKDALREKIVGRPALDIAGAWQGMHRCLRNVGVPGAGSMAVAAVDTALWDLKAKLLGVSLIALFGGVRGRVPAYGSGGFTSYGDERVAAALAGYVERGFRAVKMKVGRDPAADVRRVALARKAIGDDVALFVDANGAYGRKQALEFARHFANEARVSWFEEPRPSTDLEGLRFLCESAPSEMDIAAGEYGDTLGYFHTMLSARAVDCLQADVTRCGGFTGFLKVAALCEAFALPLSAHCAPALHAHLGAALECVRHVEYFHDHERIERMLFDGATVPVAGMLEPDRSRPGHGLELKHSDAERYRVRASP
jgi:L-alanine-DL-glutamate epimerase-like enolase superfamily enzyme